MPGNRRERLQLPLTSRIKDGKIFLVGKKWERDIIYLKCRTKFCAGTARKLGPDGDIVIRKRHSDICYANRDAQLKANFREALKSMLGRNFWKLKEAYESVAAMFPREIKAQIPYNSIKSSMKRWRSCSYPPCPQTLERMAAVLQEPQNRRILEYDVSRLTCQTVNDTDGRLHVLLYDEQFVQTVFSDVSRLFIDGTFQTTPRIAGVYQLVSILGVRHDHALPFVHILMSSKTQCGYTAVLTAVKDRLVNSEAVVVIMSDFEQALRNACRDVFTNAHIAGCNVHYDRALLKKIKSLRLGPLITEDEAAKLFLKKIMALAYLPTELIEAEYYTLKANLPLPLKRRFTAFLTYYERQWLRIVKPVGFCVFGLSRRTNNVVEAYNSILADKLGVHPSAWTFINKLTKLTANARDDFRSLQLNKRISRHPRYSTIYKKRELIAVWRQLHANEISVREFLEKAAMLKGHISQRIMRIPDELPEEEEDFAEAPRNIRFGDPDYDYEAFQDLPRNDFMIDNAEAPAEGPNNASDSDDIQSQISEEPAADDASDTDDGESQASLEPAANYASNTDDGESQASLEPAANDESDFNDPDSLVLVEPVANEETVGTSEPAQNEMANDQSRDGTAHDVEFIDLLGNERDYQERARSPATEPIMIDSEESMDQSIQASEVILDAIVSAHHSEAAAAQMIDNGGPSAAVPEANPRVSASRKKNLRKKRRRQMKAQAGEQQVRPYGHKRRRSSQTNRGPKCVVCLGGEITHGFVPCGHNCVCVDCATILADNPPKTCPKCRQPIERSLEIFRE